MFCKFFITISFAFGWKILCLDTCGVWHWLFYGPPFVSFFLWHFYRCKKLGHIKIYWNVNRIKLFLFSRLFYACLKTILMGLLNANENCWNFNCVLWAHRFGAASLLRGFFKRWISCSLYFLKSIGRQWTLGLYHFERWWTI